MRLSFLILSLSCHHVLQLAFANEITVTRNVDGDVFTIPGSCHEACMVLSRGTASPYGSPAPSAFADSANDSCTCQCNYGLPVFREDFRICVDNIQECDVTGFVSSSGLVEKVPYVYLPRYEQIIYPQAEIKFEGAEQPPLCLITGVQQLGRNGWSELRNISDVEFPLRLFQDKQRTFLQWTGESKLHEAAEGKIVVVKLACRDSYPAVVFTPCVAFRVAGSPSRNSIKEVSFSTSLPRPQGLTSAEYAAIGVSSIILALIYVASVSLYLHGCKERRKSRSSSDDEDDEVVTTTTSHKRQELNGVDVEAGLVKCNPLLQVPRAHHHHFESDTNSAVSEADLADKLLSHSESESELDNITSAIIHSHEDYNEPQEQVCNSGSIIGERLPEEDVRVVETTENGHQNNVPVFPGTQRRKLYFNPAYFERQLLLAPPPAAIEFLLKIREVISIAKHKLAAKRFVPSLNEIPEESSSDRQSSEATAVATAASAPPKSSRKRASSLQPAGNRDKSLRCTGCPGCSHGSSTPNLPGARGLTATPISGESRVRAWLEDVKLLDARWRGLEDERHQPPRLQTQQSLLKPRDPDAESARMSSKSLPVIFKEQKPHKRLNGTCVNETFTENELTKNMKNQKQPVHWDTELAERSADKETNESRQLVQNRVENNNVKTNMRRAIENSFIKQQELLQSARNEEIKAGGDDTTRTTVDRSSELVPYKKNMLKNQINNRENMNSKAKDAEETRVLLEIINDELSIRSSSDAKRIMDAVIQELVITKEMEKETSTKASDYETDSLEKTKISRKSSSSPVFTDKSSPALSSALPMDEELTMTNAIIDVQISETMTTNNSSIVKNHNLPEVVPLRPENYALVSEVYVNNGYTSPAGSDDDSGPEIQYEPENPGHLTIKVVDSPTNYVKQDESEYEPDTLDRKPMKLKINGDISYDKDAVSEVYVDSLERTSQILLRSKSSFKEENANTDNPRKPSHEYSSLREIYEARLKYQQQLQQSQLMQEAEKDRCDRDKKVCKYTSPLLPRHERRQRKSDNPPDVVPKPPPPPPPDMKIYTFAKNVQDRSFTKAGDPTICEETPVGQKFTSIVGNVIDSEQTLNSSEIERKTSMENSKDNELIYEERSCKEKANVNFETVQTKNTEFFNKKNGQIYEKYGQQQQQQQHQQQRFLKQHRGRSEISACTDKQHQQRKKSSSRSRSRSKSAQRRTSSKQRQQLQQQQQHVDGVAPTNNLEDSAYVSSPGSDGSRRQLLLLGREPLVNSSGSESDESSAEAGANCSESGAESIETDSVFFGNFRHSQARDVNGNEDQAMLHHQIPSPVSYAGSFQIEPRVC